MASSHKSSPPPGRPQTGGEGQPKEHRARGESYGLVMLVRHVKRDGRALILYEREGPPAA
ncbi:MAG TPA: hypothetical protein VGH56_07415 [Solirubrobacteraceae bacterium]